MRASLRTGTPWRALKWPAAAALLVLSLAASAHDGGAGHSGGSHARAGHMGAGHAGARHGGFHRGGHVFFGLGYWPSWYFPDPYGYGYLLPGAMYGSPVYVEQGDEGRSAYWYYCADSKGYYPYVQQCPGGWLPVLPAPAKP
jgi:hypothetical protein